MATTIVKIDPRLFRIAIIAAVLICVAGGWFFARWNFANSISSHLDSSRPESRIVAEWLLGIGPSDPQTHFAAALTLEKTFDPSDLAGSLKEYELAASLSPNNYVMWMNLGKARSANGDIAGSDAAFRKALDLAPNNASLQWAYGNSLIRHGKPADGFSMIVKAASAVPEYSQNAVTMALQIFEGDIGQIRTVLGDSSATNAALASALAQQSRFDDAIECWSKLSPAERTGQYAKLGESLAGKLSIAGKFPYAASIFSDIRSVESERPAAGQVNNGGFESGVKLSSAGLFEWQVSEGTSPQVGLSESQKRTGKYGLVIVFNAFETVAFRNVSQTIAVAPGAEYVLESFYKSDIRSAASLKWEVIDAATNASIAVSSPLVPAADWTPLILRFKAPVAGDGVTIRLIREGCSGPACPMNGRLALDDISIKRL